MSMYQVEAFKRALKRLLPNAEYATVQGNGRYLTYATIHNGKGALNARQRYMNKATFFRNSSNSFKLKSVVARTDPNYQDEKYIETLLDIVNLAWKKALDDD